MATIISREPKAAPQRDRQRFFPRSFELARIKVPEHVAEFIESKRNELLNCQAREVYNQLKEEYRFSPDYTESQRLQYLYEFFWTLSGGTRITVHRMGEEECVPTDLLERENSAFGFDKVQPCVVLSIRVHMTLYQRTQVWKMIDIVEKKMRIFKTDFYLHDMLGLSRDLGYKPFLWNVADTHTFKEVLDADGDAVMWADYAQGDEGRVRRFVDGLCDDTWMGAALSVSCSDADLYYYHDGEELHKVSRDEFKAIHDRYVESVRGKIREIIDYRKVA